MWSWTYLLMLVGKVGDISFQIILERLISICNSLINIRHLISFLAYILWWLSTCVWSSVLWFFIVKPRFSSFKFPLVCVYVFTFIYSFDKPVWVWEHLSLLWSIEWNLQLNVRNKSAAAECYIRTEVCLEGCAKLADKYSTSFVSWALWVDPFLLSLYAKPYIKVLKDWNHEACTYFVSRDFISGELSAIRIS